MNDRPVTYLFADQFARLEAAKAYIEAGRKILEEALNYENRNSDVSYLRPLVASLTKNAASHSDELSEVMLLMQSDLLVENGKRETVRPPVVLPGAVRFELSVKSPALPPDPVLELTLEEDDFSDLSDIGAEA